MYSFDSVLNLLLDDPTSMEGACRAAIRAGKSVNLLPKDPEVQDRLLRESLRDTSVDSEGVEKLLASFLANGSGNAFERARDIVVVFAVDNASSTRLDTVAQAAIWAMSHSTSYYSSPEQEDDRRREVRQIALTLAPLTSPNARGRVLTAARYRDQGMSQHERIEYANAILDAVDAGPQVPLAANWATAALQTLISATRDEALLRRLLGSVAVSNLNTEPLVFATPGENGDLGFSLLQASKYAPKIIEGLLDNYGSVCQPKHRLAVSKRVLNDPTAPLGALLYALVNVVSDDPRNVDEYETLIRDLIARPILNDDTTEDRFATHYERDEYGVALTARGNLLNTLSTIPDGKWVLYCYRNHLKWSREFASNPAAARSNVALRASVLISGRNSGFVVPGVDADFINGLYRAAIQYPEDNHTRHLCTVMFESGLLSDEHLDDLLERGWISAARREQAREGNINFFPFNEDGFPAVIRVNDTFDQYMISCRANGLSTVAALGLFSVDARIPLEERAQSREDFVRLVSEMPDEADGVPPKVWSGLNRVRDALPVSHELAERLVNIGGPAAKFGSKNLVKITFG